MQSKIGQQYTLAVINRGHWTEERRICITKQPQHLRLGQNPWPGGHEYSVLLWCYSTYSCGGGGQQAVIAEKRLHRSEAGE